jgi:hypothetical protein
MKPKKIKPIDGFTNVSDADVVARGTNIQTSMTGNANFPSPPVDMATLKAAIESFSALIAEGDTLETDGGFKAISRVVRHTYPIFQQCEKS